MTTRITQRERGKTHPKVLKAKAFHVARGLCVCSAIRQTSCVHSFTSLPAPPHVTPRRTRPSFLKGLLLASSRGREPLLLSCHRMARRSLSHCILQEADIPMMLLKSGTFRHTARKTFWWGQRRPRYVFPKELTVATAFDVW